MRSRDLTLALLALGPLAACPPDAGPITILRLGADPPAVTSIHAPAVVGRVAPGSPAASAGIEPGDRILAIDGRQVLDWTTVVDIVQATPVGATIAVSLQRGEDLVTTNLTTAAHPSAAETGSYVGIGVAPPSPPVR